MKTITKYLSGDHDEELDGLIAKLRGWKKHPEDGIRGCWDDAQLITRTAPPPFATSLDSCRELLADLTEREGYLVSVEVSKMTGGMMIQLLRATARQICVAYLIVKCVLK